MTENGKNLSAVFDTVYSKETPMLVAVDNVIFGFDPIDEKLRLLLFKRRIEPYSGHWSLIGSFINSNESAEEAAHRILLEFTGLKNIFLKHFNIYSEVDRDPGSRVISIAYYSLIRLHSGLQELIESHSAQWFDIDDLPELVVDHEQIASDALSVMQEHCRNHPIGFKLLPDKFTLPKLLALYRQILRQPLDDRNFRKKIIASGLLERLDEKDKSASKKGAYLYRFNEEVYFKIQKEGSTVAFV